MLRSAQLRLATDQFQAPMERIFTAGHDRMRANAATGVAWQHAPTGAIGWLAGHDATKYCQTVFKHTTKSNTRMAGTCFARAFELLRMHK